MFKQIKSPENKLYNKMSSSKIILFLAIILILITYGMMTMDEAKNFKPSLVFPNEENNLLK